MKRERPNWDEYFMQIAEVVASRSPDPHTQVGAVIVDARKRIIATGYNGFPQGIDDAFWERTGVAGSKEPVKVEEARFVSPAEHEYYQLPFVTASKYDITTHAEANAIAASGASLIGGTIYTSLYPCNHCACLIITAGIKEVVYKEMRDKDCHHIATHLLTQANVKIRQI